jgi:hypothetical protein
MEPDLVAVLAGMSPALSLIQIADDLGRSTSREYLLAGLESGQADRLSIQGD